MGKIIVMTVSRIIFSLFYGLPAIALTIQDFPFWVFLSYVAIALMIAAPRVLKFSWKLPSFLKILSHTSSVFIASFISFGSLMGLVYGTLLNQVPLCLIFGVSLGTLLSLVCMGSLWWLCFYIAPQRTQTYSHAELFGISLLRGVCLAIAIVLTSFFTGVSGLFVLVAWYSVVIILS